MTTPFPPIEPPRSRVRFPDPRGARTPDVIAVGCDFSAGTLRFDSWDETPGAQITGALKLEGGDSQIEGTFSATVCAAR